MRNFKRFTFAFAIMAALVYGCGGSSTEGGGGTGGSAEAPISVFITDDLSTNYDHVWVTVKKLQLVSSTGARTAFDSSAGVTVDLKTLRDSQGSRFRFLSTGRLPAGTYTAAIVHLDKDLVLYPTGSASGQARTFAGVSAGQEDVQLQFNFSPPLVLGIGGDAIVIDFDLSRWTDDGQNVTAVVQAGDESGLEDEDRQDETRLEGTITGLSGDAPNHTFTLNIEGAGSIEVRTDSETRISFEESGFGELANGQVVEVEGRFDANTRRFNAVKIEVEDDEDEDDDPVRVEGPASEISEPNGRFVVAVRDARGLMPATATVPVQVTEGTAFFTDEGRSIGRTEFFQRLAEASKVEVEGALDNAGVLVAVKAELEDEQEDEAEVRGAPSNVNVNDRTFVLTVSSFSGLFTSVGARITVATTVSTEFRNDAGEVITSEQFYAALSGSAGVEAEGSFDPATGRLLATKVKLDAELDNDEVEIEGPASNVEASQRKLTITVREWEGALLVAGQQIVVTAAAGAAFEGSEGQVLTAEQFFASVASGARVDARGVLTGGQLLADRLRIK